MIARTRVIALTLLALAVPTFAFGGEQPPPGPANLSVSASLQGCGLANAQVTCQIGASWNALEGADYYTVSVTRPDGVVLDLGQTAGTSRSIFVPYVGAGNYSVQVAAWGTAPGEDEPEVVARDRSFSTGDEPTGTQTKASRTDRAGEAGDGHETDEVTAGPAPDPEPAPGPSTPEPPVCDEDEEPEGPEESQDEIAAEDLQPAVSSETEQYDPADADGDDGCALEPSP
jgi:hypothetical protein